MDFTGFAAAGAAPELDRALYAMQDTEGQRYAAFFATLEQAAPQCVARATALAFFSKSSLREPDVEALYTSIKSLGVVADPAVMNETEFVLGMHMIVCLTKRGLATLPVPFPTYLFPSLVLPTPSNNNSHADLISSMPSPEKPGGARLSVGGNGAASARSSWTAATGDSMSGALSMPLHTMGVNGEALEVSKLAGTTSLVELAQKEAQNKHVVTTQLAQIDQSEATTLQHLQATLSALAAAVEQLGFPVPPTAHASIGAVDDLGNLLRANVQSIKQEIQSLEIAARMRSVADEASSRTNSRDDHGDASSSPSSMASAAIADVAKLSAQLATLQHEAAQLRLKKDTLARQVLDRTTRTSTTSVRLSSTSSSGSSLALPAPSLAPSSSFDVAATSGWGEFSASPASAAVAPLASVEVAVPSSEATCATSVDAADAFAFSAFETPAATVPQPQDGDFGWGAFQ